MLLRPFRLLLLALALATATLVAPAAPAGAAVYPTCSVSGCSAAQTALTGWKQLGLPTTRAWYAWPYGQYNFAGGRFYNYDGQLPSATYYEYDVYPRPRGAARDAYRIVVNRSTGATWYSPDHYADFYRIA
jgi:ribonuclease T1